LQEQDKAINKMRDEYPEGPPEWWQPTLAPIDLPTDKAMRAAGFVEYKDEYSAGVVRGKPGRPWGTKAERAKGGRSLNFGQQTMIDFLASFKQNKELWDWGPWYIEDISREDGGDTVEHGSHEWGLDVDISIPVHTEKVHERDRIGRQAIGKKKGSKEEWNFKVVEPDQIDVNAAYALIKHCFGGKYSKGKWKVKNIFLDKDLIRVIRAGLKERTVDPKSDLYDPHLDIRTKKDYKNKKGEVIKGLEKDRKFYQYIVRKKLSHVANHKSHFHIRLFPQ